MSKKTYSEERAVNHKLHIRLWLASDAIHAVRQNNLKKLGITVEQAGALHIIHYFKNRATAFELAKALFRKPPAMTILLRRLEKKNLITKTPDPGKKNIIRLSLTRKGHELYHKTMELPTSDHIFSKLTPGEKKRLCTAIETLRDAAWSSLGMDVDYLADLVNKLDI